ncbi:hypothetical protein FisN_19Lu315 [Fistulifera solaris]|uniref:Uncharacterized protein n=1 Tax=Fistulifera solaris TaxID=1519565 RepID=A0A1Z5K7N7_FISSO|nr:hypothetical protein FisN_19Lu315 [Fistulifera solaris]|eukprot:GAX22244.1 hypothetical protein FisN_19Lu315 [Fistulifera solaris]
MIQSFHVSPPLRSASVGPLTTRFVKQPSAIEEAMQPTKKKDLISTNKIKKDSDEKAYQRKMAISFFLADSSLFGFVLLAVVAVSGALLNAFGYGYVVMPDGTMVIDTLEHFQMQYWIDAIPPMTTPTML